jgi:hypothetical protein
MKSIAKLSLVLLTAMAFAAFPADAQTSSATTNAAPAAPKARAARGVSGAVSAVDATAMTITVKTRTAGDVTVKVTSETKITKDREPAVFADVKEGLRVSIAGKKEDDGSWIANTLRINTKVARPPAATPPPATTDQK